MSQPSNEPRVVPAQLDFLTLYNPTLSDSDESFKDQIVFYYSRRAQTRRIHEPNAKQRDDEVSVDADENDKLRQVGLAQGMVNLAKNFSNANVDTVETEKSRIVLHELEKNWWILAAIDLTRLPTSKRASIGNASTNEIEFSAREVSPAQLLIVQLVRANSLFLLHHASNLEELLSRVGRGTFCELLDRFWTKFARGWDVLLHGNPATAIYNATKLGGGGELGIGVGEEEWGSGEREVLEGFIERTEGLRDLIVGRYGLPPETDRPQSETGKEANMWLGTNNDPVAADGVIFSGKGLVSRRSLRTVSQWMETIFKSGTDAYGVGENPSSRPRQRRKRTKPDRSLSRESSSSRETRPKMNASKAKPQSLRRTAMENSATPPGIPAPLVNQVERSLNQALTKASTTTSAQDLQGSSRSKPKTSQEPTDETSSFGKENMMKYLTLGYGTAWTLNPKGLKDDKTVSTESKRSGTSIGNDKKPGGNDEANLQEMDPTPDVSEDEQPFQQRLEQSIGKFLIGLSGDLEQAELDSDDDPDMPKSQQLERRLFLRTLTIEMAQPKQQTRNATIRANSYESQTSTHSKSSVRSASEPKTSAAASVDGPQPTVVYEKVQVAVYVHQPFMFVFLFELHTPSLTMPSFYRSMHNQLGPLQKPLLRSTDPSRIADRIAEATSEKSSVSRVTSSTRVGSPIYDLIFDPTKLTVRTSIPNIPIPGSLAAEGLTSNASASLTVSGAWYTLGIPLGTSSPTPEDGNKRLTHSAWSRTEALNAHTQLINTYLATREGTEVEHTVKTARGWWVLWMKISPSLAEVNKNKNTLVQEDNDSQKAASTSTANEFSSREQQHKEAFLVRRAADFTPNSTAQARSTSSGPGKWLLREQRRDGSGTSTAGGPATAKGVSDGVGVDARKWIDGLLTLTQ